MSVGALLVQPQRLARASAANASDAAVGDVVTLAAGLAYDALKGGSVLATFEAAGEAMGERFLAHSTAGLDNARKRLATMLEAPVAGLGAKLQELGHVDGPDAALAAAHDLVAGLVHIAEELTIDHIRQHLGEVLDIVETDLGLTPTFLQDQAWALIADVVDRLEHVAPEADASLRANRIRVIGALRRLERRAGDFQFPQLDVEPLAEELFALLRRSGLPDAAARVACMGAGVAQAAQSGRDVLHAVPFTGFLPGSIGAAVPPTPPSTKETYLWYPSWLSNNHRPWWVEMLGVIPADEVRVTTSQQIVERATGRPSQIIGSGTDWGQLKHLSDEDTPYSFGVFQPGATETIAWVLSIAANGFELLFHLISLEQGDYASNTVNAVGAAGYGTWKTVKREPFPWFVEGPFIRGLGTFIASFEGIHTKASGTNKFLMWLTLAGPDFAEMLTYKYLIGAVRDLLLSVMTLMNHQPPASSSGTHPRNRDEVDGVRHVVVMGLHNLFLLAFKRKNWGVMKPGGDMSPMVELIFLWSLLFGICVGAVGGLLGTLAGEAIARDVSNDTLIKKMWWGIPQAILLTPFWLYLQQEGSTDSGKYTPFGSPDYPGYPKPASASPYKLPYDSAAVGACYVGQANEGLWSHNFNNVGQVYAFDFSLDQADEILAARPGTVVAFFEGVPDDTNPGGFPGWNFVAIRHDVDDSGAAVPAHAQDLGQGGTPTRTVAIYGHGRTGSVTAAFARHTPPVPTANIVGAQVKQGMPIMDAGSTGISFHNHLHMHVVQDPGGGYGSWNGAGNTIPFVFSDPDAGGDGVPYHFNWYRSANVRRLS